jgi:hypothetical protein
MSNNKQRLLNYKGIGMAIGLIFGWVIGSLAGNPIVFAGGTMILGFAIGTAIDQRKRGNEP